MPVKNPDFHNVNICNFLASKPDNFYLILYNTLAFLTNPGLKNTDNLTLIVCYWGWGVRLGGAEYYTDIRDNYILSQPFYNTFYVYIKHKYG